MKNLTKFTFISILLIISAQTFANPINLYKEPDSTSPVEATVAKDSQLIPIYYPNEGNWLKVANPKNGQVGWLTFEDLKGKTKLPGFEQLSFTQHIESRSTNNSSPQAYRVIQYSGPKKLNPEEIKELVRQMQVRQSKINATMQLMLRGMLEDFNNFAHMEPLAYEDDFFTFPKLQPMLIVPSDAKQEQQATDKNSADKPSWWKRMKKKMI